MADSSFTVSDETFEIGSTGRVGSRHGFEFLTFGEHRPGHAGILGCDCDDGLPVAAPLGQRHRPAAEPVLLPGRSGQRGACPQDQQRSQITVAGLGDAPEALLATGAVLSRHESEPGGELSAVGEVVAVADAGQQRAGGGRADAGHLHQAATTLTCSGRRAAAARQALCRRGARGRARRGLATLVSAFGPFTADSGAFFRRQDDVQPCDGRIQRHRALEALL